jgi:hygromycin-B 7''-O-kinase
VPKKGLLPRLGGRSDYERLRPQAACWLPVMRAICARHELPGDRLEGFSEGTNVVFAAGPHVLKLYPPHYAVLAAAERAVAERLAGALPVETPRVEAAGEVEGWPYLVESRLRGRTLGWLWPTLDAATQARLAAEVGTLLADVHRVPTAGLDALDADWPGTVRDRTARCVGRHRQQGAHERWLAQIPAFLDAAGPLYPPDFPPALVTGDAHGGHLMVEERTGTWRLSGLFDFDDAQVGHGEYDLAAAGLIIFAGRSDLLRIFLRAYGYAEGAVDEALGRRLLAYTLLHRYRPMAWWMAAFVPGSPNTLDELARAVYTLA